MSEYYHVDEEAERKDAEILKLRKRRKLNIKRSNHLKYELLSINYRIQERLMEIRTQKPVTAEPDDGEYQIL